MRGALIAVVVLVSACSSTSQQAVSTATPPAPAQSVQPSQSPSASSSPRPSPSQVQGFGFACLLPIAWSPSNADANAANSGTAFLEAADGSLSGSGMPPAPHFLTPGPSYDPAVGRWLPVPASAISPDGLHYAYAEWDRPASGAAGPASATREAAVPVIGAAGRVHLVDAQTGADSVLFSGQPTFSVISFAADGIYLGQFSAGTGGSASKGLYLLGLGGGTPQPIAGADVPMAQAGWTHVDRFEAWGTTFTSGIGTEQGPGNQLLRLDLITHKVTTWLTMPIDHFIWFLGLNTFPLVLTMKSSYTTGEPIDASVVLLTGANQSLPVMHTDNPDDPLPNGVSLGVADSHGLWIGGDGTLFLYTQASGLRHITLLAPESMVVVSAPCA